MHLSKQGQARHSISPRHGCLLRLPPHLPDEPEQEETGTRQAETGHPEQCRSPKALPWLCGSLSRGLGGAPVVAVQSGGAAAGSRLSPLRSPRAAGSGRRGGSRAPAVPGAHPRPAVRAALSGHPVAALHRDGDGRRGRNHLAVIHNRQRV